MEPDTRASEDYENEHLLSEVVSLRTQLQETERHLKNLGEELHSTNGHSKSDLSIDDGELGVLTMEDLIDPSELHNSSAHSAINRMSWCDGDSPRKLQKKCYSLSFDKSMEEENELLREKLNILRGRNELLTTQNHDLMNEIETINFELKQTKARVSLLESTLGTHSVSIPMLEEQIGSLEAEVQAQDSFLRDTEDKLEQSQKMAMEKEYALQKLKEDYKKLKLDFIERTKLGKRTEHQRDEALYNAEELTRTFKKYKEKITAKLEKVQAEEQILERNLMNCVKENEKLESKCDSYRSELENLKEQMRQLVEETCIGKENLRSMEARNSEMELLLKHSQQKIQLLESRLQEQGRVLEEKNALIKENADLKTLIAKQQDQLQSCQQDIENSKIELKTLENVISQLSQSSLKGVDHYQRHNEATCANCSESSRSLIEELRLKLKIKDTEIQKLQAEHMAGKIGQEISEEDEGQKLHGLETEPVKLTEDQTERKCKQLEITTKQLEKEKQILIKQLEELHTKLEKSEEENKFLKDNMAQRTTQFQAIQEELLEKAAKSTTLEREIARKTSQLSTLEKQLEEKTVAYTSAVAKKTELEQELVEVNSQLHNLERNIKEEHEHFSLMLEKTKIIHLEQHKEMEKQIELLQSQLETKNQQFLEQENTLTILQQDILRKQRQIESLDQLLIEGKEEIEKQKVKKEEALQILQEQLSEETIKVKHLQTALDICKDDLALYLSHIEENRALFEKQLKNKSEEVQRLQKEMKLKNGNLQSTNEQNLILQQTLQQQQQMLHQETIRNSELEDSQTKLQKQVTKLEHELQKQRENLEEELRKTNEKLHLASEETDLKRQKVTELTGTISQIKIEMDQCKDELIDMEKELVHLRRDGHAKAMQLGQLEMTLEQKVTELHEKAQQVRELEDKLLSSEKQQKDAAQKIKALENDVQNANAELKNTLRQLQDLRDVLHNAQMSLEEKYAAIQDLTEELRDCKDELEEKKQELLDMDKALKERNWDLKQRAAQVTKLDMSIREHRGELEQKIIKLEAKLEKEELQIKECYKQIESLESKLKHAKDELHEKEFNILQQDQEINSLKKEMERKQQRLRDMEKKMKEQEKCIAEQYKEVLDLGQQLRLEREQMQHIHGELLESRRQQAQTQRDVDRISLELEEVNHLSLEKESRANHLAEELGAAQAREMQLEARMQANVQRLSAEIESLKQSYLSEKLSYEAQQTKWRQSLSKSHHVRGQLQQLKMELDEAQGTVYNLQQQLQSRNEIIQAANEALLLKGSEVTRLQARIGGHERTEGIRQLSIPPWSNDQEPDFATKHSQISSSPHKNLHCSTSSNHLSIKNNENLLNMKPLFTLHSSVTCGETKDVTHPLPDSLNESSFDPLTHIGDEDLSGDSNDFQTLSGMLKYINKEMKTSESSSL
nr:coiled-coil domain-containing protein 18 isoform X1 [Pogona vitticeps]XP_020644330.1 coiled-coil domain-containing protein 18 isoform X1 [Pogona vitticeps]